jgi:lysophospholipase L1-like esterase
MSRRETPILLGVAALIMIALVVAAFVPIPRTLTADDHDATLTFRLDRAITLRDDDCTTVTWETDGIREIFLNGEPVIGMGEETICASAATFRVAFPNNAEETYTLTPILLTASPWLYIGVGLAVILALVAVIPRGISRRVARVAEIGVIWAVILFLLLEGGVRLFIATTGSEQDRLIYLGSPSEIAAANRTFVSIPFVNFGLNPAQPDVNDMGYRNEPFPLDKPDGEIRVVAMGGSTTYGWQLDAADAYPQQLEGILQADYGYDDLRVVNAGVPSYTTWHTLVNFQFRVLELDPDVVMIYHGVNDGGGIVYTSPDCWRGENLNVGLGAASDIAFDEPDLPSSAFQRYIGIRFGLIPNPAVLGGLGVEGVLQDNAIDCERAAFYGAEAYSNPPDYFERNLRSLVAVADAHDVQLVFSTWASRWSQVPEQTSNPGYVITFELNDIVRDLATELDVPLIDLAADLPLNLDYWQGDEAHQTALGTRAQAEIYAAFLTESGLLPE